MDHAGALRDGADPIVAAVAIEAHSERLRVRIRGHDRAGEVVAAFGAQFDARDSITDEVHRQRLADDTRAAYEDFVRRYAELRCGEPAHLFGVGDAQRSV